MNVLSGTLFYLGSFAGAFAFGFPLGPSSIEMLRLASLQRCRQASSLAAGNAFMNAVWASAAMAGLHPWLEFASSRHQGFLFLIAALACSFLARRGGIDAGPRPCENGRGKRLPHFWMGALIGASYPMTLASWIMALAVLRGLGWEAPPGAISRILFFLTVFLGYLVYLALLRFLFARLQGRLTTIQNRLLQRLPRYLLLGLALLFLVLAALRLAEKSRIGGRPCVSLSMPARSRRTRTGPPAASISWSVHCRRQASRSACGATTTLRQPEPVG